MSLPYKRQFGARCARCAKPIVTNELIMRALTLVFHLGCFGCVACQRQLRKGDQFVLREGLPLCRSDFERQAAPATVSSCDSAEEVDDSDSDAGPADPGPGKRPRTVLSAAQRRRFKAVFELNAKPNRKVREALAVETGLSMRVVQVWFQNQRAKVKKLAMRTDFPDHRGEFSEHGGEFPQPPGPAEVCVNVDV